MVRGVLISGVSLKRGSTVHTCNVRREGGGQGCPYFRGVLKEGFHCNVRRGGGGKDENEVQQSREGKARKSVERQEYCEKEVKSETKW